MVKEYFKRHCWGFLFACVAGIIIAGPSIVFISTPAYQGIPFMNIDEQPYYLSRMNAAYNGCVLSCNPYIKEYSSKFPFWDSTFPTALLALPGMFFHIPVTTLKVIYEFLLPCIVFLLIYSLMFRITRNLWWSLIAPSFILLGFNLVNSSTLFNLPDLVDVFLFKIDFQIGFLGRSLPYTRLVNPQFSSIIFFGYLHVLLSAIRQRTWYWFITLGVVYGFAVWTYFFTYTFLAVVNIGWVIVWVILRDWSMVYKQCASQIIGLVVGLPLFTEMYYFLTHPYYAITPTVDYLIQSHVPDISVWGFTSLGLVIIFSYLYYLKERRVSKNALFILVLVLACYAFRNQHVITGKVFLYDHYERYIFSAILPIAICFLGHVFIKEEQLKKYRGVLVGVILVAVLNGLLIQCSSYSYGLAKNKEYKRYVPVLQWLRDSQPQQLVISAPNELANFIPFYTHDFVLSASRAKYYMYVPGRFEEIEEARNSPRKFIQVGKKYNVDYFVEDKNTDILRYQALRKVFETNDFVVYSNPQ